MTDLENAPWLREDGGRVVLTVHAQPSAKHTSVAGVHGDALKIRVNAAPVEGRANEALIRFLADACGVRQSAVTLVAGERSRRKLFAIGGVSAEFVRGCVDALKHP